MKNLFFALSILPFLLLPAQERALLEKIGAEVDPSGNIMIGCVFIRKSDRTVNYCNTYTLYLEEESLTAAVCLLTLFIDCTQYPDMGEVVGASLQQEGVVTVQKALLARYDPEFIPRIVEQDGPLAE